MGLRCSCGVRSNPIATDLNVLFFFNEDETQRTGTLTVTVNACADTLDSSILTVSFVDQSGVIPNRSFTFTATSFDSVFCFTLEGLCAIDIIGTGLVTGEITPRGFLVRFTDQPSPTNDEVNVVFIPGFAQLIGSASVQPDLTFFGCPPTP